MDFLNFQLLEITCRWPRGIASIAYSSNIFQFLAKIKFITFQNKIKVINRYILNFHRHFYLVQITQKSPMVWLMVI